MFNGYVLYLQAVTTPNPFVKLPKLPFHKSLLLIFCLRLRFPFSFFKLFFAAAALVIFRGGSGYFPGVACFFLRLWLFPTALVIFPGWPVFPAALVISHGFGYFPGVACFSGGSGYFPRRLWLFSRRGNSNYTVLDIFLPL